MIPTCVAVPPSSFNYNVNFQLQEINLVHARLNTLANLRLPRFGPYLKRLCLRQNQISSLEAEVFRELVELEELDLYDNKLKHIGDALDNCSKMT